MHETTRIQPGNELPEAVRAGGKAGGQGGAACGEAAGGPVLSRPWPADAAGARRVIAAARRGRGDRSGGRDGRCTVRLRRGPQIARAVCGG